VSHAGAGNAGVRQDDVKAAEALERGSDRAVDRTGVGHVGCDGNRVGAGRRHPVRGLARAFDVDAHDARALLAEARRRDEPEPRRGAGHERDLSVEPRPGRHQAPAVTGRRCRR
jgi:hypothetical protein